MYTAGVQDANNFVKKYRLDRSMNGEAYRPILTAENSDIWEGNTNDLDRVRNVFPAPVDARYIRLTVVESAEFGPALSWGVLGCPGKKE